MKTITVQEIHDSFDNSHNLLESFLIEEKKDIAKRINNKKNAITSEVNLYDELDKLGFKNNRQTIAAKSKKLDLSTVISDDDKNAVLNEAILKHHKKFPFHKYIDLKSLYKLLDKYNLYLGIDELYTGDIPIKNAKDLIDFDNACKSSVSEKNKILHIEDKWKNIPNRGGQPFHEIAKLTLNRDYRGKHNIALPYYIVAPLSDFNTEGCVVANQEVFKRKLTTWKGVKRYMKMKKIEDPIILKPVFWGGVLLFTIVTKWGPEAMIPEFQNPLDN